MYNCKTEFSKLEVVVASLLRRCDQSDNRYLRLSKQFKKLKRRRAGKFSIWNLIIVIFCLVASIYQASRLTDFYLKHDVTAEALFFPTDPIIPPMVTICVNSNQTEDDYVDSQSVFRSNFKFTQLVRRFAVKSVGFTYWSPG